jgi:hypothetical protein
VLITGNLFDVEMIWGSVPIYDRIRGPHTDTGCEFGAFRKNVSFRRSAKVTHRFVTAAREYSDLELHPIPLGKAFSCLRPKEKRHLSLAAGVASAPYRSA